MNHRKTKKNEKSSEMPAPRRQEHVIRFSWPLLAYPAMFLITLVILLGVSRSIKQQSPMPPARERTSRESMTPPDQTGQPDPAATIVENGPAFSDTERVAGPPESGSRADAETGQSQEQGDDDADGTGQTGLADARESQSVDIDSLQGPARVATLLRMAIEGKDHARIKQCMDELVAMGNTAVVSLNDLVGAQGEAGLWAAEALARIGTPMAASALLEALARTKEGLYKEALGKRVSHISNHESWPLLLDTMMQTGDAAVVRAAATSLSRMADTPVLDEIIGRYDAATTEAEFQRLSQLVRNIQSPQATNSLLSLAGDVASPPQDDLQRAAINALANVGNAQSVDHLLRRLEATPPGEGTEIYNAITRINDPDGYAQLLYAAAGSKDVSAEYGRAAAIQALGNYPSEETCALLERIIAQESNEKVVTAATRALDEVRRAAHAVTAKADALQKSEEMFPLKSAVK